MPQFVYGDSYGGVQSASQAATNSDRQLMVSLMAAAQQGQQLAAQRQAQQQQLQAQYGAQAIQQQQAAESAREFDANLAQRQAEKQSGEDLGYANLGLNEDRLAAQNDKIDQQLALASQTADQMGQPLADSLGNALSTRSDAFQKLQESQDAKAATDAEVQKALASGNYTFKKGIGLVSKDPEDKSFSGYAVDINNRLEKQQADATKAADDAKRADRALQMISSTITKSGFTADMSNGTIVHAKTGQPFSFLRNVNSQPVPASGSGAPSMPVMPTKPDASANPGFLSNMWNGLLSTVGMGKPAVKAPQRFVYDPQRGLVPVQ